MDSANTVMDVSYEMTQFTESDSMVDSAKAKEQRVEAVIRTTEESGEQSQATAGEGPTPYTFLTLEELEKLRETIRKTLREID